MLPTFFLLLISLVNINAQDSQYFFSQTRTCKNEGAVLSAIKSMTIYNRQNGYKLGILGCYYNEYIVSASFFANDELYEIEYPIKDNSFPLLLSKLLPKNEVGWITIEKTDKNFEIFQTAISAMLNFTNINSITPLEYMSYTDEYINIRFVYFLNNDATYILMYPLENGDDQTTEIKLIELK